MIKISYFDHKKDIRPKAMSGSWEDFVSLLEASFDVVRHPDEKGTVTPMVSPAIYDLGGTRANHNVRRLASWLPMDIDHNGTTIDEMIEVMDTLGVDYVIHSTTNHRPESHSFRLIVRLDRETEADDSTRLWTGAFAYFGSIADIQTKDRSRGYFVPASWEGTSPRFVSQSQGGELSVDLLISYAPPPPQAKPPVVVPVSVMDRMKRALQGKGKAVKSGTGLFDSPVVSSSHVDRYLNLPRGEHHLGLYHFMTCVASRSLYLGYSVTAEEIGDYARQLNDISFIKTASNRKFSTEARRALQWATHNINTQEFITNAK